MRPLPPLLPLLCLLLPPLASPFRPSPLLLRRSSSPPLFAVTDAGGAAPHLDRRVATYEITGDVASGAVERFLLRWSDEKFGRDNRGPFSRSLGVPLALSARYANGFTVVLEVSRGPVEQLDAVSVLFEPFEKSPGRPEDALRALVVVDRTRRGMGFAGGLGPQIRALCLNAEKNLAQALADDLKRMCGEERLRVKKVVQMDVDLEELPTPPGVVDVEVKAEARTSGPKAAEATASRPAGPGTSATEPSQARPAQDEKVSLFDAGVEAEDATEATAAFESFEASLKDQQRDRQGGHAFRKAVEDDSSGSELDRLFRMGTQAAETAAKEADAAYQSRLGELGAIGAELATFEASEDEEDDAAGSSGGGYDSTVAMDLEGGLNIFAGPESTYTGTRRANLPAMPKQLRSITDAPALESGDAQLENLLAASGNPEANNAAGDAPLETSNEPDAALAAQKTPEQSAQQEAYLQRKVMEAAADAVLGPSAGPDAPSPAVAAAAALRLGNIAVSDLVKSWPQPQREAFVFELRGLRLIVSALATVPEAAAAEVVESGGSKQAEVQALLRTLEANRAVLMSDNYPILVRALLEGGAVRSEADRTALLQVNEYALAMVEQLQETVRVAEQQQLEKIARLCRTAQEDMLKLPDEVRRMRPLLNAEFVAYLRYAIEKESADIAKGGLDPEQEPTEWLQVLNVIRKGVLAEKAVDVRNDVEILQIAMAPNNPEVRRNVLNDMIERKFVPEDLPQLRQTALNMAGNFRLTSTEDEVLEAVASVHRGEHTDPKDLRTRVLQLERDMTELLPDARITKILEASKRQLLGSKTGDAAGLAKTSSSSLASGASATGAAPYVPPKPRISAEQLLADIEEAQQDDFGGFGGPEDSARDRE